MIACAACRHENPDRARFCLECGARLAAVCPQCSTELPSGAKFCLECGHRLAAPPAVPAAAVPGRRAAYTPRHLAEKILESRSALEGERRQVTVLFADIAGFTALAEERDPEDVHRIIDRCFELITAEVHRLEGTVNQYTGDGVMALFGAPIAHEDAPRRAVHAALGIQWALQGFSRELEARGGPSLRMRIGLNTGPVVVGRIGDDLRMDYTAVGDTTNLAARMQQHARPGTILVTDATHRLVSGYFETVELGEVAVKGRGPVRAFEVVRARGRRTRLDVAAERGLTPVVGRERELAILTDLFAQVRGGRGQVVLVSGDAGLGKSRLLLEFRRALATGGTPVTWLEGQCLSFGSSIPFLPLVDQLRRNFGIEELDGEPEIVAKVERGMRQLGEIAAHIPFVRYLLSVDPGSPEVVAMEAGARRQRIFAAMRALTLRGARVRPIVLVFEDLHWVDASTEEYLKEFVESVAGIPVMVVLAHRPGYAPPFPPRSFQTALTLQSLTETGVAAVAARVLGVEAVPPDVLAAIMARAEGVPLFVEEVTKTLLDLGVLQLDNGACRLAREAGTGVPDTIQGIFMARLDRLGENGKRTVQLASVIGRQFLVRLLERISELRDELDGVLQELRRLEVVYDLGLLPEPAYVFKHALIQDVAYQSLLVQTRMELHRAVGHAIEELYADRLTEHLEKLAHHFWQGEAWDKAFEYLVRSAERAAFTYANATAVDAYGRALDIAPRVEPPVPVERLIELHLRRGELCTMIARSADGIAEIEQAATLCREVGNRRMLARALGQLALAHFMILSADHLAPMRDHAAAARDIATELGDEDTLALCLFLEGTQQQVSGDLDAAERTMSEAIRLAEARGLRLIVVKARVHGLATASWRGDLRRAVVLGRETVEEAGGLHEGFYELFAQAFVCQAHIGLGQHTEALALIADGLAKAGDRGNRFIQGRLNNTLGWLHQELGDFQRALDSDRESVEIGRSIKNENVEISALINLGYDHLHLGQPQRALEILADAQRRAEKGFGVHRWRWDMHVSTHIAEALTVLGRLDAAAGQLTRADTGARRTGSAKYVARCHLLRGELGLLTARAEAAEADFSAALAIARRLGAPTQTWQAARGLAQALAASSGTAVGGPDRREQAHGMASLAAATIRSVAERLPDPALARTLLGWGPVQDVFDTLDRLRRT